MSHPFDLMCKNHPEREIDERGRADRFCSECYIKAWNAGARVADATWADDPKANTFMETNSEGQHLRDYK